MKNKLTKTICTLLISQFFLQPLSYSHAQTLDQKLALMRANPETSAQIESATQQISDSINHKSLSKKIKTLKKMERLSARLQGKMERVSEERFAHKAERAQRLAARIQAKNEFVAEEQVESDDEDLTSVQEDFGMANATATQTVSNAQPAAVVAPQISFQETKSATVQQLGTAQTKLHEEINRLEKVQTAQADRSNRMPAADAGEVMCVIGFIIFTVLLIAIFFIPAFVMGTLIAFIVTFVVLIIALPLLAGGFEELAGAVIIFGIVGAAIMPGCN